MDTTPRLAIITQSYSKDLRECLLLCESIDRFVPDDIDHYIFVNDEDFDLFARAGISDRHRLHRKSEILPRGLVRCPVKMLGHHYHLSICTIPVREWIIQQICKLGVFDAIGDRYDAVMNVDSETIFMRPFKKSDVYDANTDSWLMYRNINRDEPCHEQYCRIGSKYLDTRDADPAMQNYCYMSNPVIFVRDNLKSLIKQLGKGAMFSNWKLRLCNTYRFSENYLYGMHTSLNLGLRNHYITDKYRFPIIHIDGIGSVEALKERIDKQLQDPQVFGTLLQKHNRTGNNGISFSEVETLIHFYWNIAINT